MKTTLQIIISVICFAVIFYSCKKDGYSITESGLRYHFFETKNQQQPKIGEILRMHLIYRNSKDSVLYDSKILGDSFLLELSKSSFKGDLSEGFGMMGEGDSASFLVSADSIFDKLFHQTLPPEIHKSEILKFDIRLHKIMSRQEMNIWLQKNKSGDELTESEKINLYLINNKLDVSPVKAGVYYIPFIQGNGMKPSIGDEVTIKYVTRSLGGVVFDASDKNGSPVKFILGQGKYIQSFTDAILTMKEGAITRVILSSANAYGASGYAEVPPNTAVIIELELIHVKARKPF